MTIFVALARITATRSYKILKFVLCRVAIKIFANHLRFGGGGSFFHTYLIAMLFKGIRGNQNKNNLTDLMKAGKSSGGVIVFHQKWALHFHIH